MFSYLIAASNFSPSQNLAAETAAYLTTKHPDYAILAARIAVSNLHKETKKNFSSVITDLYEYINPKTGKPAPMVSEETYRTVMAHKETLDSAIIYNRDFSYNLCVLPLPNRCLLIPVSALDSKL